jgi:carbonic anhydrase
MNRLEASHLQEKILTNESYSWLQIKDKLDALAKEVCAGNEEARIPVGVLDNKLLRKNTRKYYRYVGSFTSPPCTENVIWNILGKVIFIHV